MHLFNIKYEVLCIVELQHEYYTHEKFTEFYLQPSSATTLLMRQCGLLSKQIDNKLYLLVQVEQLCPKRPLDNPICWSFYIFAKNDYFTNFTNIRLDSFRKHIYHFSNLNDNKQDSSLYLTRPTATYQKKYPYQLGDWVQTSDSKYWEAISPNPQQTPKQDSNEWQPRHTTAPCASFQDRIPLLKTTEILHQTEQSYLSVGKDTIKHTQPAVYPQIKNRPGLYQSPQNTDTPWQYIDDIAWQSSPLAVVDIHHHPANNSAYALLNKEGQLQTPHYFIRFASRSTLWRYLIHNQTADTLQDKSKQHQFAKINDREFVSQKPIPLSQEPIRSLMLQIPIFGNVSPLPNPGIQQIIPHQGLIYSNIHLNY